MSDLGRSEQDNTRGPMKAMLWEEAKGKLRALVAVQGSYFGLADSADRWQRAAKAVEAFIEDFEGDGLHE